ncbi:AaceriAER066Wp [[Ashbya] aceris (nom. inval.)]|nr:AaceriAER066Wp [[Ashbya] aceris (nom. inval.)]
MVLISPSIICRDAMRLSSARIAREACKKKALALSKMPVMEVQSLKLPKGRFQKDMVKLRNIFELMGGPQAGLRVVKAEELRKCLYIDRTIPISIDTMPDPVTVSDLKIAGEKLLSSEIVAWRERIRKSVQSPCLVLPPFLADETKHPQLLEFFLKKAQLNELARVRTPALHIKAQLMRQYDRYVFCSMIGYFYLTNDRETMQRFLDESVTKRLFRYILAQPQLSRY